ncbi:MAG: Uma2 family endonuclease [Cytophagales bacterium]|nr:MAG: Uma2 family endonuclease [Cytophagales bacterium]
MPGHGVFGGGREDVYFELIEGVIFTKKYPTATHQTILSHLLLLLGNHLKDNQLGELYFGLFPIIPEPTTDVQPDLFIILNANLPNLREEGFFGVPDITIEILSPSSFRLDRNTKFNLYERTGVGEYWIVDTKNQSIEVYGRQGAGFDLVSFAVEKGAVESGVVPGLSVEVSTVFA